MVERQPEKLKVVGSSPIPDIMLFFASWVFCLLFINNFPSNTNGFIVTGLICTIIIIVNLNHQKGIFIVTKPLLPFFLKVSFNSFYQMIFFLINFSRSLPSKPLKGKWKPLFKKSSYFGIYRSCRNQHLNK